MAQYKANFDPFARETMDNCNNSYSYTKPYFFGAFLWPIRQVWSIEQSIVFWWDVFETKYLKTCDQLFTIVFPKFDQETMIKSNKSLICIQAANCNCCSGYLCVQLQKDDRKWQKSETSTSSVRIFRRQDLQFELPQFLRRFASYLHLVLKPDVYKRCVNTVVLFEIVNAYFLKLINESLMRWITT